MYAPGRASGNQVIAYEDAINSRVSALLKNFNTTLYSSTAGFGFQPTYTPTLVKQVNYTYNNIRTITGLKQQTTRPEDVRTQLAVLLLSLLFCWLLRCQSTGHQSERMLAIRGSHRSWLGPVLAVLHGGYFQHYSRCAVVDSGRCFPPQVIKYLDAALNLYQKHAELKSSNIDICPNADSGAGKCVDTPVSKTIKLTSNAVALDAKNI